MGRADAEAEAEVGRGCGCGLSTRLQTCDASGLRRPNTSGLLHLKVFIDFFCLRFSAGSVMRYFLSFSCRPSFLCCDFPFTNMKGAIDSIYIISVFYIFIIFQLYSQDSFLEGEKQLFVCMCRAGP